MALGVGDALVRRRRRPSKAALAKLSDDEVKKRLAALGESVARFNTSAFALFRPLPFQVPWVRSKAQYRILTGANQIGKTSVGGMEVVSECTDRRPFWFGEEWDGFPTGCLRGKRVLACGETWDHLKDVLIAKLEEYVTEDMLLGPPKKNQQGIPYIWKFVSGAMLKLMTYEQPKKLFEGAQWDFVWFDEPPPRDIWVATIRGMMARRGRLLGTFTPLREPWILDDIILPSQDPRHALHGKVENFTARIWENCLEHAGGALPHDEIAVTVAQWTPAERAARENGLFLDVQALEFDYVSRESHVVPDFDPKPEWPVVEVLDPSYKRGLYVMWFCLDPRGRWYAFHAARIANGAFSAMCADLKNERMVHVKRQPDVAIMDCRGGAHEINKETQDNWFTAFRDQGLHYRPSTGNTPMEALHEMLRVTWRPEEDSDVPRLRLTRRVAALDQGPYWALRRFQWNPMDTKRQQYNQPGKDWVDCMRYLAGFPGLSWQKLTRGRMESVPTQGIAMSYAAARKTPVRDAMMGLPTLRSRRPYFGRGNRARRRERAY